MRNNICLIVMLLGMSCALRIFADGLDPDATFAYAGKLERPFAIDGKLDDPAWSKAVWLPLAPNLDGCDSSDRTHAAILHDGKNIYLGFECDLADLDPVLNLTDALPTVKDADNDLIFREDCVEVFFSGAGKEYFHIAVNGLGAVYDAHCVNGGNSIDTSWNCQGLEAKASIDPEKRRWTAELEIPLASLNLPNCETPFIIRGNLCRAFSKRKIQCALSKANGSFHQTSKFADLLLGDKSIGVKVADVLCEKSKLTVGIQNPGKDALPVDVDIRRSGAPSIVRHLDIPALRSAAAEFDTGESAFSVDVTVDGQKVYSSSCGGAVKAALVPLLLDLNLNAKASLYFNNELKGEGAAFDKLKLNCHKGVNTLALELKPEARPRHIDIGGTVTCGADVIPLSVWLSSGKPAEDWRSPLYDDSKWERISSTDGLTAEGGGTILLRKNIIVNHSIFSPQWENDNKKGYFAQGTVQSMGIRLTSPFAWPVSGMSLNILMPENVEMELYQIGQRKYSWPNKLSVEKDVDGRMAYRFDYQRDIPRLTHHWGPGTQNLYFKVKAVGDGTASVKGKGRIWFEWRNGADIELKNDLDIVLLPKPAGRQPKDIPIYVATPGINALITNDEAAQFLAPFKMCGINYVCLDGAHGSVAPFIGQAGKLDIKTQCVLMTYRKYATYDTIAKKESYAQRNRQSELVNQSYRKTAHEAPMCPLAFMDEAASFVSEELLEQVDMGVDCFLFDIELSPGKSCFCERCRTAFSTFAGQKETLSQAAIMKSFQCEWVDYVAHLHASMPAFYRERLKKAFRHVPLAVYSGYHDAKVKSTYGMDWALYKDSADVFMAGYGRNPSAVKATMERIGGRPMVLGEHLNTGGGSQYEKPYLARQGNLKQIMFRRLVDGKMGGVLLWDWLEVDGRGWHAIGEATRAIATFEDVFLTGERPELKTLCDGVPKEDVAVFRKGDETVVVLFNDNSGKTRDFSLSFADDRIYRIWNFYPDGKASVSRKYVSKIAPGDIAVIDILPAN